MDSPTRRRPPPRSPLQWRIKASTPNFLKGLFTTLPIPIPIPIPIPTRRSRRPFVTIPFPVFSRLHPERLFGNSSKASGRNGYNNGHPHSPSLPHYAAGKHQDYQSRPGHFVFGERGSSNDISNGGGGIGRYPIRQLIISISLNIFIFSIWFYFLWRTMISSFIWPSTLIISQAQRKRIWEWEIAQGHYPSKISSPPKQLKLGTLTPNPYHDPYLFNPSVPFPYQSYSNLSFDPTLPLTTTTSIGLSRKYLSPPDPPSFSIFSNEPDPPKRPIRNSILDLDFVIKHCSFDRGKYVKDCLELLAEGVGLPTGLGFMMEEIENGGGHHSGSVVMAGGKGKNDGGDGGKLERIGSMEMTPRTEGIVKELKRELFVERLPSLEEEEIINRFEEQKGSSSLSGGNGNGDGKVDLKSRLGMNGELDRKELHPLVLEMMMMETGEMNSYENWNILNLLTQEPDSTYPNLISSLSKLAIWRKRRRLSGTMAPPFVGSSEESNKIDHSNAEESEQPDKENDVFDPACDPNNPRIFHAFWTGPFTDKPYMLGLSFLFTQNLGLQYPIPPQSSSFSKSSSSSSPPPPPPQMANICRPQLWFWLNPGRAGLLPSMTYEEMIHQVVEKDPWSAPFTHDRFKEVIKFKLWNTTEQLDSIAEFNAPFTATTTTGEVDSSSSWWWSWSSRSSSSYFSSTAGNNNHNWRSLPLFKSVGRGRTYSSSGTGGVYDQIGSSSSSAEGDSKYDRLSTILSDLVRFALCHRFGGVYLDVDTVFLRDWEEVWGWNGGWGYRWSRLETFNTAAMRIPRRSALGSFIFQTGLAHGLNFHPHMIWKYVKDAGFQNLFRMLPDALFDSGWLNIEGYQTDRPAIPYFKDYSDFFFPLRDTRLRPEDVTIENFFRGALSYHYHNQWWRPFDPSQPYPNLGSRFPSPSSAEPEDGVKQREGVNDDDSGYGSEGLSWSAYFKRTFEEYLREERNNFYGEKIEWGYGK